MHEVEMQEASEEFAKCWKAAGSHIQRRAQGPIQSWLKVSITPPFLEHLSFRLGNQLFFVRLEDVDGRLLVPGTRSGLLMIADGCKGYPCIMPMRRVAGAWTPEGTGWGLIDARSEKAVDPITLISDERIEMTDWELQDFAVQIVRDHLKKDGKEIMSCQGNPAVDPSIWFVGEAILNPATKKGSTMTEENNNADEYYQNVLRENGLVGRRTSIQCQDRSDTVGIDGFHELALAQYYPSSLRVLR